MKKNARGIIAAVCRLGSASCSGLVLFLGMAAGSSWGADIEHSLFVGAFFPYTSEVTVSSQGFWSPTESGSAQVEMGGGFGLGYSFVWWIPEGDSKEVPGGWGFGGELGFLGTRGEIAGKTVLDASGVDAAVTLRYRFGRPGKGWIQPYLGGGLHWSFLELQNVDLIGVPGSTMTQRVDATAGGFLLDLRAGAYLPIGAGTGLTVEFRRISGSVSGSSDDFLIDQEASLDVETNQLLVGISF